MRLSRMRVGNQSSNIVCNQSWEQELLTKTSPKKRPLIWRFHSKTDYATQWIWETWCDRHESKRTFSRTHTFHARTCPDAFKDGRFHLGPTQQVDFFSHGLRQARRERAAKKESKDDDSVSTHVKTYWDSDFPEELGNAVQGILLSIQKSSHSFLESSHMFLVPIHLWFRRSWHIESLPRSILVYFRTPFQDIVQNNGFVQFNRTSLSGRKQNQPGHISVRMFKPWIKIRCSRKDFLA